MIQSVTNSRTGNGTLYLGTRVRGRILAVKMVADSSVTASWIITITGETTAIPILYDDDLTENTTNWRHPRALAHQDTDGAVFTESVAALIPVLNERIKCVIAGSAAGVIEVTVYYDSDE